MREKIFTVIAKAMDKFTLFFIQINPVPSTPHKNDSEELDRNPLP